MRIKLGTFETFRETLVDAWIQPEQLIQAPITKALTDTGPKLLLTQVPSDDTEQGNGVDAEAALTFGPGDRYQLNFAVGAETFRRIWDEFEQYMAKPFFAINRHPKHGQLYAELSPDLEDSAIILTTRQDSAFNASLRVEGRDDLAAFLTAGALEASLSWMPTSEDLSEAIEYGERNARSIHADQQLFAGLAFTGLLNTAEMPLEAEVNRYIKLQERAVRPPIESFTSDDAEFYRWYKFGGIPRIEPLSQEQALLEQPGRFTMAEVSDTAISESDWDWFKTQKLGDLRPAFDQLQQVVAAHDRPSWISELLAQADWCADIKPPQPAQVYGAVENVLFRSDIETAAGREVPSWISNVREARDLIQAAFPGIDNSVSHEEMRVQAQRFADLSSQADEHQINGNELELHEARQELKNIIIRAPHLAALVVGFEAVPAVQRYLSESSEMEI